MSRHLNSIKSTLEADQACMEQRFSSWGFSTTRIMMLPELTDLFPKLEDDAGRLAFTEALNEENVLANQVFSKKRLTLQQISGTPTA